MAVSGISLSSTLLVQTAVDARNQLNDLNRQLGTGLKTTTYSGLGLQAGLTVGLRSQLSSIKAYEQSNTQIGVRLSLAQTALSQIASIGQTAKTAIMTSLYSQTGVPQARDQGTAKIQLDEVLGLLNTNTGDRYLFSGNAIDTPAVQSSDIMLNGQGSQAGLKQMIAERSLADHGSDGLGRLVVSQPSTTSVGLAEDAVSPFGFKLSGITSQLTGATVTAPSGSPATESIDLGPTNPNAGDTVKFTFKLPDGTSEDIVLTATNSTSPGPNEFTIGATTDETATSLKGALAGALSTLGSTALTAASAVAAGNDFFNADAAHPPQRIDGPPFETATALKNGTSADTVSWYTGDAGSDPARSTQTARIDPSFTVGYGARANEDALRSTVRSMAVYVATSFDTSDPNSAGAYSALQQRISGALSEPNGKQKIADIQGELAGAQTAIASAKDRHQQTTSTLSGLLDSVQGASPEETAAKIMALQTSLQATLQTTAMLLQTNLLKYL